MSATLSKTADGLYTLELVENVHSTISAHGPLGSIRFEQLLPMLPIMDARIAPSTTLTIYRTGADDYALLFRGDDYPVNLRCGLLPFASALRAIVPTMDVVQQMIPLSSASAPSPPPSPPRAAAQRKSPPRTRLRTGAEIRVPERLGSTRVTRSAVRQALLSRRRKSDPEAAMPARTRRRIVAESDSDDSDYDARRQRRSIKVESDSDNDSDDDSDVESVADMSDFIVPDDDASDDASDAEAVDDVQSDDEQTLFSRMRRNNVDEFEAFRVYMHYLSMAEPIPDSETAARRIASYPGQLAASVTTSGVWKQDLIDQLRTGDSIDVADVDEQSEEKCDVCHRTRTISHVVTITVRKRAGAPVQHEYRCGPVCAQRVQVYWDLMRLGRTLITEYSDADDAEALQRCWDVRRAILARAADFAAPAGATD